MNWSHLSIEELLRYIRNGILPDDPMEAIRCLVDGLDAVYEDLRSSEKELSELTDDYDTALGERHLVTEGLDTICDFILLEAKTLKEARAYINKRYGDFVNFDR